jgi:SPP1 family predicted phage head-tail adaptor
MATKREIIESGKLRHRIQLISLPKVQGAMGGPITADAPVFAIVWGRIEALSGRELYKAQQMVAQVTHLVTIRWLAGVKSNMEVWFSEGSPVVTRQFRILYQENPDEKHHVLLLYCLERDDSAYEGPGQ